jgi:hypothetical protein
VADERVGIDGIGIPDQAIAAAARAVFPAGSPVEARLRIEPGESRANGRIAKARLEMGGRQRPIVVKAVAPGMAEAAAYSALAEGGAPVAQLYAWFRAPDGREVLLLEHLPRVGIDGGEREFGVFVEALAAFNAVVAPALPTVAPTWLRVWLASAHRAWERARSGAWGEGMRAAAAGLEASWPALGRLASEIQRELGELPLDATHQDPNLENCGWRDDGSLVFFDLSSAARYAAFADLGLALGGATQPWPSANGRGPWIERYREAYARRRPDAPSAAVVARAVDLHIAAAVMWFDDLAFARADRKFSAEPPTVGALAWYERKWRRLRRMPEIGIAAATEP